VRYSSASGREVDGACGQLALKNFTVNGSTVNGITVCSDVGCEDDGARYLPEDVSPALVGDLEDMCRGGGAGEADGGSVRRRNGAAKVTNRNEEPRQPTQQAEAAAQVVAGTTVPGGLYSSTRSALQCLLILLAVGMIAAGLVFE
jgi:hypothetical protein